MPEFDRIAWLALGSFAGQGQDGAAAAQEVVEDPLQVRDGVAQPVGTGQLAEQVAGDQEHVHLLGLAAAGDALDGAAQVVGAVDPAQAVAQVPVGGVQEFHNPPLWADFGSWVEVSSDSRLNR